MTDPFSVPVVYGGFKHFLQENPNRIYRYWVYRHGYTPYEQKKCFPDESLFESTHARFGVLREVIPLSGGNAFLGFAEFMSDASEIIGETRTLAYYRVSDLQLVYAPIDANDYDTDGILTGATPTTLDGSLSHA